jgi:hypothetical protein
MGKGVRPPGGRVTMILGAMFIRSATEARRRSRVQWADVVVVAMLVILVCLPVWLGIFTIDS